MDENRFSRAAKARMDRLTPEKRREVASAGGKARWARYQEPLARKLERVYKEAKALQEAARRRWPDLNLAKFKDVRVALDALKAFLEQQERLHGSE